MKSSLLLLVCFLVVIAAGLAWLRGRGTSGGGGGRWPFVPRKPMSVPEQVLYFRLLQALPEHIVLAQVQLSRFLGVKRGHPTQAWLNRINRQSVDFLILARDATVLAAIELDDKSHNRNDRRRADDKKNRALSDAGVRLIRWNVASMPAEAAIRIEFAKGGTPVRPLATDNRIEPSFAK